jgi:hypothetical protein
MYKSSFLLKFDFLAISWPILTIFTSLQTEKYQVVNDMFHVASELWIIQYEYVEHSYKFLGILFVHII